MRSLDLFLAPLKQSARAHHREHANAERESALDIRTECSPFPVPPSMKWSAIDANTYDCDCDQDGFFSRHPVGTGPTREAAIEDLLEQLGSAA